MEYAWLVILLLPVDAPLSLVTPTSLTPTLMLLMAAKPDVLRYLTVHALLAIQPSLMDVPPLLVTLTSLIPTTMQPMDAKLGVPQ